jgi:hypothetical protein
VYLEETLKMWTVVVWLRIGTSVGAVIDMVKKGCMICEEQVCT